MHSTAARLSSDMQARLATGYDQDYRPAKNWDFDALAGCGALRSTADDMLNFLAANLEITESPLASALQNAHRRRRAADKPDSSIGLGWMVRTMRGTEITWHNGGTLGYYCFVGFDKRQRTGVVILTNWVEGIEDIGAHLLLGPDQ
jgi:CubicO group peptidase (beta-lactamase class C family)